MTGYDAHGVGLDLQDLYRSVVGTTDHSLMAYAKEIGEMASKYHQGGLEGKGNNTMNIFDVYNRDSVHFYRETQRALQIVIAEDEMSKPINMDWVN